MLRYLWSVFALLGVSSTTLPAQPVPPESLLVAASWLYAQRNSPDLVVVHVDHRMAPDPPGPVIQGAVELDYMRIVPDRGPLLSELPEPDSLQAIIRSLGISNQTRVVLYSTDPIMAARAFLTLEAAGHTKVHLLDGGAAHWQAAGYPMSPTARTPQPGSFRLHPGAVIVDAPWVQARLGDSSNVLIDTRTAEEYRGGVERRGVMSEGHLPGARLLLWQEFLSGTPAKGLAFKPRMDLTALFRAAGAEPGRTITTYCYLGYRASLSYFVARYLGYAVRMYDGSYNDWSARRLPLVRGETPR